MAEETKDIDQNTEEVKDSDSEEKDTSMEEENETKEEVKDDKKDASNDEDNEEEGSDEEDDEPQIGSLERPVVLEDGRKRERKKVERMSFQSPETEDKKFEIVKGKGTALGDIPFVDFKLSKTKAEDTKPLHRLLFRRVGTMYEVKKNIRKFSGFTFDKEDQEYEKRQTLLKAKNFTLPMVKSVCEMLDVPRGGTKDEIIERLLEWLMKPEDSGKKVPTKRKRSEGGKGKKGAKKEKKEKKQKSKPKSKSKEEVVDDISDDDDDDKANDETKASSDEEPEDKSEEEADSDEEPPKKKAKKAPKNESDDDDKESDEEPPKKKAKKVTTPKVALKKPKKKEVKKETPKPKKASPKKKATPVKKKAKAPVEDISDISSDSDDEPLQSKSVKPKGPPTNDELKDVIKKMLDNANLEEVTMKTVLKDVYAKYPTFDLSDRKDFVKNTVKQIIS